MLQEDSLHWNWMQLQGDGFSRLSSCILWGSTSVIRLSIKWSYLIAYCYGDSLRSRLNSAYCSSLVKLISIWVGYSDMSRQSGHFPLNQCLIHYYILYYCNSVLLVCYSSESAILYFSITVWKYSVIWELSRHCLFRNVLLRKQDFAEQKLS